MIDERRLWERNPSKAHAWRFTNDDKSPHTSPQETNLNPPNLRVYAQPLKSSLLSSPLGSEIFIRRKNELPE